MQGKASTGSFYPPDFGYGNNLRIGMATRHHRILFLLLLSLTFRSMGSGQVESISFATTQPPPASIIPKALQSYERPLHLGLASMPEGALLVSALTMGAKDLGLTPTQTKHLAALITRAYSQIQRDPDITGIPSALPYCFSTSRPTRGHYFMYRPEQLPEDPVCIIFLHGVGGNFLLYPWMLKQEFPDAIQLFPSWSLSWEDGSATYLKEMMKDAETRTGFSLNEIWLMGISTGARRGFSLYQEIPDQFAGLVSLADAPPSAVAQLLTPDMNILMLNGTGDTMMPIEIARRQSNWLKPRIPGLQVEELDGDSFFILTHPTQTFDRIRAYMNLKIKNP
jgi:predicted esterase